MPRLCLGWKDLVKQKTSSMAFAGTIHRRSERHAVLGRSVANLSSGKENRARYAQSQVESVGRFERRKGNESDYLRRDLLT